jgi:hypothetical protein
MPTLQQQIADKFLAKVEESSALDSDRVKHLRLLLVGAKRPKVEDLVKLFSQSSGDVK